MASGPHKPKNKSADNTTDRLYVSKENIHKQAIDSSAADNHVNNGSVWIGKHAYTHTHTHTHIYTHTHTLLLARNQLKTLLFRLGIFWFVILNCTLDVLSGGLIHCHLKNDLPTGYISSERAKDTLSVHRPSANHHSLYPSSRTASSWNPVNQSKKK
jgi:hypothetical protein